MKEVCRVFGLNPGNASQSGWINVLCPIPGHHDTHPSFGFNFRSGCFNCYCCGSGDFITLAALIWGTNREQAREQLERRLNKNKNYERIDGYEN